MSRDNLAVGVAIAAGWDHLGTVSSKLAGTALAQRMKVGPNAIRKGLAVGIGIIAVSLIWPSSDPRQADAQQGLQQAAARRAQQLEAAQRAQQQEARDRDARSWEALEKQAAPYRALARASRGETDGTRSCTPVMEGRYNRTITDRYDSSSVKQQKVNIVFNGRTRNGSYGNHEFLMMGIIVDLMQGGDIVDRNDGLPAIRGDGATRVG